MNLDLCWRFSLKIPAIIDMQIAMAQNTLQNWWVEKLKANTGLDGEIIKYGSALANATSKIEFSKALIFETFKTKFFFNCCFEFCSIACT